MNTKELYQRYREKMRKIADVRYPIAVLSWDQEVNMPAKGADHRGQQIATLSGIAHDLFVEEELGNILEYLSSSQNGLSEQEKKNVQETLKDYKREQKYPTDFVIRSAKAVSEAFNAWVKAKEASDFKLFEKQLQQLVDMKLEETKILGYKDHPYDALLDIYEPGAKTKDLEILFEDVKKNLVDFVRKIAGEQQHDDSFLKKNYPKDKQWDFGIYLLKQMGYDFEAGRQDISPHPFTTNFSALDVRVTTKINEHDFKDMTWSCIHEGGHALYEQGLDAENYGLPLGESISLGIHESQSRLWENNLGRCLPYWKANYPKLQEMFPEILKNIPLEKFYKAINLVKPSLIRIQADELTYHFHILIRFEIEKGLMEGSIKVKDLPKVWNEKYKSYLNVDVPNDAKGVLQDVHWSHGSFGYFPTYSLGSFYAAQFYNRAKKDIPDMESEIEKGNMNPLLEWLRKNIHRHGRFYRAEELCQKVTGEKLNFKYFMEYAKRKFGEIYGTGNK